jgi:hypothetical protein
MDTGVAAAAHGAATSPAANTPAGAGSLMSPPPPKRPRSSPPGSGGDARAATAAGAARGSVEDIEDDGGSGSDEEQPSFVQHDVGDAAPRGAAAAPIDGGASASDDEDDAGATDDDDDDGTDYVPVTVDSRRDRDGRTEYYVSWQGAKNPSWESPTLPGLAPLIADYEAAATAFDATIPATAPAIPKGKSKAHFDFRDGKLVFFDLDVEVGGKTAGIIQLSAQAHDQAGNHLSVGDDFDMYVKPKAGAQWNLSADAMCHGLSPADPRIATADTIETV